MKTAQPVSPLGYLFVKVVYDHERMTSDGLDITQVTWNIRNMPTDEKRRTLIEGLRNGSIDPNPFNWPTMSHYQEEE